MVQICVVTVCHALKIDVHSNSREENSICPSDNKARNLYKLHP